MGRNRLQYLTSNDWIIIHARSAVRSYMLGDQIIEQGDCTGNIYVIRSGEASVEVAGTGSRAIVATLGPEEICGEIAFLEQGRATAAVVARDEEVEVDVISAHELQAILEACPRLAARFYRSLALVIARRLKTTSGELAREMALRDRHE